MQAEAYLHSFVFIYIFLLPKFGCKPSQHLCLFINFCLICILKLHADFSSEPHFVFHHTIMGPSLISAAKNNKIAHINCRTVVKVIFLVLSFVCLKLKWFCNVLFLSKTDKILTPIKTASNNRMCFLDLICQVHVSVTTWKIRLTFNTAVALHTGTWCLVFITFRPRAITLTSLPSHKSRIFPRASSRSSSVLILSTHNGGKWGFMSAQLPCNYSGDVSAAGGREAWWDVITVLEWKVIKLNGTEGNKCRK